MNAVKENAYAKINLYLDVTRKREDGFHEIKTVMHTVSLYDELTVSTEPTRGNSQVRLFVTGASYLPTDGRNIAVKAATLFLEHCGIFANINIKLKKNIPVAAGLAGGSSDAAATLRAMNRLFGKPLGEKAMLSLAAELGSDVPYCFLGKTALCEGRGEIITRLADLKGMNFLIVRIAEHISTPLAYSALDKAYADFEAPRDTGAGLDALTRSIAEGEFNPLAMFNIFEPVVFPLVPSAEKAKLRLKDLGADGALMSGSGPTVFGVFKNIEEAQKAEKTLTDEGYNVFLASSV